MRNPQPTIAGPANRFIGHSVWRGEVCRSGWHTLDEVQKGDMDLRERFYTVVATLARSDDHPLAAITNGAKALEQLKTGGIDGLRRGEVLAIAISVVGTLHPETATWFRISRIEAMGQRLFGRKLFAHPQFEPTAAPTLRRPL